MYSQKNILGVFLFSLAVAVFSNLNTAVASAGEAFIRMEEPSGLDRDAWPAGIGFPFARDEVREISHLALFTPQGKNIPFQAKALSRWPDGSIRWVHLFFMADMKAQQTANWKLVWGKVPAPPLSDKKVTVSSGDGFITVNTGPLKAGMRSQGFRLFESVKVNGKDILTPGVSDGFRIITTDGAVYETALDRSTKLTIEEEGPLRAIIRAEGRHRSGDGRSLFDFICRMFFYAGKPWCETEYSFTNSEQPDSVAIASISLVSSLSKSAGKFQGVTSEYKIDKFWNFDSPFRIYSGEQDYFGVFGGAVMYRNDGSEVAGMGYESEARSRWWVDSSDGVRGLTVSVRDMSQNYPKGIRVSADSIATDIYPSGEKKPLVFLQGWTKTQTILLYFHTGDAQEAGTRELCFNWQAPVIPWSPRYTESGLTVKIFPYSPQKYPNIERSLRDAFMAYESGVGKGMIDYGDTRGSGGGERWNFMQNNAYDTPWVSYLLFLRSGERRYWTRAVSAALHTADIDVVHFSSRNPTEIGGIRIHGPNHVQYNAEGIQGSSVAPNHEWLEGLLMTWHLTGEERFRDSAVGVADHILKAIDAGWISPAYNAKWNGARNLGWPLLALAIMYDETGDKRYLDGAQRIIGNLGEIQMENGSFPIWIGTYKAAAPLHNTIVMEALGRYYQITGDPKARSMFMKCIDSTLHDLSFPDGDLMYITHPDYRSGYRSMPWGGFHFGYVFTGDKKYLKFPYPLIMTQLKSHNFGSFGEGALSYPLRGMLFYLYYTDKAKILKDIPE
ncbi:MAG: hypothetical protein WCU00_07690 [Candidatus Latescibacterota bacterium]